MNSLQKQIFTGHEESPEAYVDAYEKHLSSIKSRREAEMLMKKLKYLGLHFDPFGAEVSSECQQVMDSLGLSSHMKNPYLATNILLRLLDKTEEHLNKLKQ